MTQLDSAEQIRKQQEKQWSLWMLEKQQEDDGEAPPTEVVELPEELCCPICYEEYCRPNRKPVTLFPCGHSICESCLKQFEKSTTHHKCCICNSSYSKTATNFQLLQIIDNAKTLGVAKNNPSNSIDYSKELQIATARLQLLSDQLKGVKSRSKSLESEINTQQLVLDHLEAELQFVQEQHSAQKQKVYQLNQEQALLIDEEQQLRNIITPLLTEVEKLKLLSQAQKETPQNL